MPNVGSVPACGCVNVASTQDTTYIITAKGASGIASTDVYIRVTEPTSPPLVQLEPAETTITPGQDVTLSWASSGADKAHIDKGTGAVPVSGNITIASPKHTTFYTLTVSGSSGSASAVARVYVAENPMPQPEDIFGYMYNDLIPPDATVTEYDQKRFAIVTGIVHNINATPIEGVTITLLDHPEYVTP